MVAKEDEDTTGSERDLIDSPAGPPSPEAGEWLATDFLAIAAMATFARDFFWSAGSTAFFNPEVKGVTNGTVVNPSLAAVLGWYLAGRGESTLKTWVR